MYALGVDLGTVFTAAATWRNGHAEISSLGSRAATIPSVVLLREDSSILTGEAANRRALLEPSRVAREFKRRFGDATPILLGGTPYSAESLMARLLKSVFAQVASQQGSPPAAMCLCHPANWGPYKIDLLQQAVRMAELDVPITFAVEPAAAAAYYARQQRLEQGSLVAVYDLGGGTFDAAVLRKTDTGFEIMGRPEGIEHLGGADFDAAVFQHVRGVVGAELDALDETQSSSVAAVARLREECTSAKETLSSDTDTTIPILLPNLATEVRITRGELENMVRPLLYDTISALQRAIRSAGVIAADLHSVLLIGGSSRMPLVAQLVGAELDRPVAVDAHPKHAVALGAAWVAGEQIARRAGAVGGPVAGPASYPPPGRDTGNGSGNGAAAAAPARDAEPAPADTPGGGLPLVGVSGAAVAGGLALATGTAAPTTAAPAAAPAPPPVGLAGAPSAPGPVTPVPAAPAPGAPVGLMQPPTAPAGPQHGAPGHHAPQHNAPQHNAPQHGSGPYGGGAQQGGSSTPPRGYPPPPSWAGTGAPHPFANGEPKRPQSFWARQGVFAATAAAAAVVLLVAIGGYAAGRAGLFGAGATGAAAATPSPSAVGTVAAGSGTSASPAAASTAPASAALDPIYVCPKTEAEVWGCFNSVKSSGNKLLLDFTTNFQLSSVQDTAHHHFHIYLANPGPNGTTIPSDAIMQHVPNAGSWFILYDSSVKEITNTTERGGGKAGIDTAKYSLLCARVAVGVHDLAKDKKGGYRTGNCAKITPA